MSGTILVVDDEESIRELIQFNLRKAGFDTVWAGDAAGCLTEVRRKAPDLVILDIMLPDVDGFTLYQTMRRERPLPVIFLTARDDEVDRVLGLELGADDYITKPFSPRELVARVKAVLRRTALPAVPDTGRTGDVLTFRDLTVDLARREARVGGSPVPLTPTEYDLLAFMARRTGQAISRDQLLDGVWGVDYVGERRIVDVHIRHLREKVEPDPANPRFIKTVRGFGYRFEAG